MKKSGSEHRVGTRERTLLEIEYEASRNFISDFALNISRGGMFIATQQPLDEGQEFLLRFSLPGSARPIELRARVMWANRQDKKSNLIPGMGVAFMDLSDEKRAQIERYVESMQVTSGKK
ncbi:MAG: TIGR02266 family protein [Nitrospirae bacterium]|nr:TIGR02266 family protein [Nitrospirota bacterium]